MALTFSKTLNIINVIINENISLIATEQLAK